MSADRVERILRDLPESFWDVSTWQGEDLSALSASVDVADRKRIVKRIIEAERDGGQA